MSDDLSGFSMVELFRLEAESQVALLTSGLLALESGADPATIEPLMRAAHSLKGAARIVGMSAAEQVAHALEEVFVAAQHGKIHLEPSHIDLLLSCVDLLHESSTRNEADIPAWLVTNADRIEKSIQALHALGHGQTPSPEPTESSTEEAPVPTEPSESPPAETPPAPVEPPISEPAESAPAADTSQPSETPTARAGPARNIPAESSDRVVRVSAENLNRLMGLAGEALVEARRLRPLVDSIRLAKAGLTELDKLVKRLQPSPDAEHAVDPSRLLGMVNETRQRIRESQEDLNDRLERLEQHARRTEDLAERLHFEVISSRLRPLADGLRGFPRLVRDVSRQLGKQVRFEVRGESTGVDRDILERLEAPLNHLIRNSMDHGIEAPEDREHVGKDPTATILLEARHVAGMLQITLSDDGRGIDVERIRRRVVERGHVNAAMAAQLTEAELLEFLFLAGFTTREQVTDLSGRGVGLDVVQSMVQSVGGSVRVSTQLGHGTSFSLQLPITMSVIRALLVRIGGEPYAFPLSRLDHILRIELDEVETIEGRRFFKLDEQTIGLVSAAQVLDRPSSAATDGGLSVVVVSDRGQCFGVVVDEFLGERDLDVRPLDARLGKVPNLNSVSILEDGWPVLIIDVEDLVRSIDNLLTGRRTLSLAEAVRAQSLTQAAKRILVVDDSITVRELERQLLEARGFDVDVAVDGMDGWNSVRGVSYDLVVSDVDMPRMDGIQFVRMIKQDPALKTIPVVIVSYKDRAEDRMRGLDAGADAYLTKSSFHDETFLRTIVDLIGEATD